MAKSTTLPRTKICRAYAANGGKCRMMAVGNSSFCVFHRPIFEGARGVVRHRLYEKHIAADVKELYIQMLSDPDLFNVKHELAVLKSYFARYLQLCETKNLLPDLKTLCMITECMRRATVTEEENKWKLTISGVQAMIETMTDIVWENLKDQPEKMKLILEQLKSITVSPNDMEGAPTMGQLRRAHPGMIGKENE